MLLLFSFSASPAGQLLYLIHRDPLVKSAFLDVMSRRAVVDGFSRDRLFTSRASSRPAARQLVYLIPLAPPVKSALRDYRVSGSSSTCSRGGGTSIIDPKVVNTQGVLLRWRVVLRLRGVRPSGPSASLWGEQVISYVGSQDRANPACIPGVSPRDSAEFEENPPSSGGRLVAMVRGGRSRYGRDMTCGAPS